VANVIEETDDLWSYKETYGYIECITTNGFVKADGEAVMGRGCALEAKLRLPWLPKTLGTLIEAEGNHVHEIKFGPRMEDEKPYTLITFPVKHNWWEPADLELIERSCIELLKLVDERGYKDIVIPRPGCGNGQRDWETEVKPILEKYFDNRFIIISK